MSFAYNTNTAFDYRRYDDREEYDCDEAPAAQAKRAADRSLVMARRVLVMCVAVVVAAVCIGLLYLKAQVFMAQRDINETRDKITEATQLTSTLKEQYNEATNINTIMDKAAQLGMGYASADQILYVSSEGFTAGVEMKSRN